MQHSVLTRILPICLLAAASLRLLSSGPSALHDAVAVAFIKVLLQRPIWRLCLHGRDAITNFCVQAAQNIAHSKAAILVPQPTDVETRDKAGSPNFNLFRTALSSEALNSCRGLMHRSARVRKRRNPLGVTAASSEPHAQPLPPPAFNTVSSENLPQLVELILRLGSPQREIEPVSSATKPDCQPYCQPLGLIEQNVRPSGLRRLLLPKSEHSARSQGLHTR